MSNIWRPMSPGSKEHVRSGVSRSTYNFLSANPFRVQPSGCSDWRVNRNGTVLDDFYSPRSLQILKAYVHEVNISFFLLSSHVVFQFLHWMDAGKRAERFCNSGDQPYRNQKWSSFYASVWPQTQTREYQQQSKQSHGMHKGIGKQQKKHPGDLFLTVCCST